MDFFDLRTAYLIMGLLYFCMPAAVWLALREDRGTVVNQWCMGGELFGVGLFLLGLRGTAPDWVSYELMGLCMNAGQVLRVASLRRELQRPLDTRVQWGLLLLFLGLYALGRWLQPQGPFYFQVSLAFLSMYFTWISLLGLQLARQQHLTSAYWLSMVYLPLGLLLLAQFIRVGWDPLHPLQWDWGSITIALMGNVTAVIGNTSFMGMFVERATRRQMAHAIEQARAAENLRLGRQIAHLDRVRGLGMVSTSLAHELSQPLSSLCLTAEQAEFELQTGAPPKERTRTQLQTILRDAAHARDVLQRIRSFVNTSQPQHTAVNLQEVNAKVLSLLKDWFQTEQVRVSVYAPSRPVQVRGDAVQLSQILVNLYRNAIEATSGQGARQIDTTIGLLGEQVHIEVRDNGPGFSAEALARRHEGFFSSKTNGLGVGLMISGQIAEMHQGRLETSNHAGGGACVRLQLPALA